MDTCLCRSIHQLAEKHDEDRASSLIAAINDHLEDLRRLLCQSKILSRHVRYRLIPTDQRTAKALQVDSIDITSTERMFAEFGDAEDGPERFWMAARDRVHADVRRRLVTVVIFLRSKLHTEMAPLPPAIGDVLLGQEDSQDARNAGRKYIKIAQRLGGLGALLWLPTSIPPSTYERYLNIDDDKVFDHLKSLAPRDSPYADFVRRLVLAQVRGPSYSHLNLLASYVDFVAPIDQLVLLLYTLGGTDIPDTLLRSLSLPQRRWDADGEITIRSAAEFGFTPELVRLFSETGNLDQATSDPNITRRELAEGIPAWSLSPGLITQLSRDISPATRDKLGETVLKLICFACPPCYEGNVSWLQSMKEAIWPIVQRALRTYKVPVAMRAQMLDSVLFFCERDSVDMRHLATQEAKALLRASMPYYLHATVVLFRSVLHRLDGDFSKSDEVICVFLRRGPKPKTRRDHALLGRLHISQIDNKIKSYDVDVPSFIYKWAAEPPLSTLEIEVTSRLQSAAARFFQSVGEFSVARASLEDLMALNTAKPLRKNSRRLLVARLADVYCEMGEHEKALEILQPELDSVTESDRRRRLFWRILLARIEAYIGLGELHTAESVLVDLKDIMPLETHDLFDEQLHMRMLLADARISHTKLGSQEEAIRRWKYALDHVKRMHTLKADNGFTAATVYLSLAHAQLVSGDVDAARHSWDEGTRILATELCEFSIPVVSTSWLRQLVPEVQRLQGWPCRMMLPGGRSEVTWRA